MPNCCTRCFSEPLIQQFIENYEQVGGCDYCGSTDVHTCDVDEVGEFVRAGVLRYYEDAANNVHYESAEGGYTMDTATMTEILLYDLDIFDSSHFAHSDLADILADDDGTGYVRRDPYGPPSGEPEEIDNWDKFCKIVTQLHRFTAFLGTDEAVYDKSHPAHFLRHLSDFFNNTFLITSIGIGRKIYRARLIQSEKRLRHEDLTSPPIEMIRNNRMSPAGISLFYGSLEQDTCIAEVRPSVGDRVAVGEFEVLRELRILDLSQPVEEAISIFSEDYSFYYEEYAKPFLRHFVAEIAKPIRPHEADILYVPTQVFTEFIRVHPFRDPLIYSLPATDLGMQTSTFQIDGIMYGSSLCSGGVNIVLFRGPEISVSRHATLADAWLRYIGYQLYELQTISYSAQKLRKGSRRSR